MDVLTPREEIFCNAIATGEFKGRAAELAGYAASGAGKVANDLLKKEKVQNRIRYLQERAVEMAKVSASDTLIQIARIAFFDAKEILDLTKDPEGHEWSANARAAIAGIKVTRTYAGDEDYGMLVNVTHHVTIRDTLKALKMLGDHTGAFTDLNMALGALRTYGIELAKIDGKWTVVNEAK